MSLAVGSRLGVFQVTDSLGAGGMGEVYRARDTELGRDVALKVLSSSFSAHPDSLARFEREARLLASLNHPHIGAIYGVARHDGTQALVLELVPGATLADLIARGPLPLAQALTIADQIADALDAAHERTIVHRDLKPANVKVTDDGTVKVLDFGIAKALAADGDVSTIEVNHTREGTILGTRSYMSPEQSRGLPVDKRTDIWSFGCVLFEMLAGRRPFAGASATDVTLAILERDPDWAALPKATPEPIRRLLRRSLEKDPRRRLRDIADARIEIADVLRARDGAPDRETAAPSSSSGRWLVHAAWAAAVVATLVMGMTWGGARRIGTSAATYVSLAIPAVTPQQSPVIAISSDGRRIAVATAAGVVMRDLGDPEGRLLPGTAGASSPMFSPDGTWLAFYADVRLKKVLVSGGDPITIADIQGTQRGFAWADNDTIIVGHTNGVLSQMPAGGGELKALTALDAAADETSHRWPHVLPGSRVMLYAAGPSVSANDWNSGHIVAQSLVTGERRVIVQRGSMPAYAEGHVFYVAGQQLLAQRFDPDRLEASGPVLVMRRNVIRVGSGAVWYALSPTGSLISLHGPPNDQRSLLWVTRDGASTPMPVAAGPYRNPRLSPDGSRVAVTLSNPDSDVWVIDTARGLQTRITADGRSLWPVWTLDGAGLVYSSTRGGPAMLVAKPANGTGEARALVSNRYINRANSWTPQGALLHEQVQASGDIWIRSPNGGEQVYASGLGDQTGARLSPNGGWVAFRSTETGAGEIFVQPLTGDASARRQVSVGGGLSPAWSHDGRELFFLRGSEVWVAAAPAKGSSNFAEARRLFTPSFNVVEGILDVAPDGRFLMVSSDRQGLVPTDFQLTLNIGDELRRRANAP